ncbi:MAG: hypothetical protein ACOX7L_09525, partial [Dethiobacteria bacterium]
ALLEEIYEVIPPADFLQPDGISEPVRICRKSGLLAGPHCPEDDLVWEIFPEDRVPETICDCHILANVCQTSGLLPGHFCPQATGVYLLRPPFIITDQRWKGGPGRQPEDACQMLPTKYCQQHRWWW